MGIYKRKQEGKKTRKKDSTKKAIKKTRKRPRKKKKNFPFFSRSLSWSSSCFLVFFYKFPPQFVLRWTDHRLTDEKRKRGHETREGEEKMSVSRVDLP